MNQPAHKEPLGEERLLKLETHVEHIQADVTELKAQVVRLDTKIDSVNNRLSDKIDTAKNWAIGLHVTMTGTLLAMMAHGFHWI